jgi:CubicO group peptidase (beta-lactamase class C family)
VLCNQLTYEAHLMRIHRFLPALAACVALLGCGHASAPTDGERAQSIDTLAGTVVSQRGVPGIAIAVVRNGKVFHEVMRGTSDLATHAPVTASTPFQLASTTKLFGSTAVLLLVADGKLTLDDTIGSHLDGLPSAWQPVTLRQLLSHTSGLPDITRATGEVDLVAEDWDRALPLIADAPLQFEPGHGWSYTQTNYALLLRLVEKVSGMGFEDFLDARLFRPLGMDETFFPDAGHRCAANYERDKDQRVVDRPQLVFPHYVHAAGGLCSSLDDLVQWSAALEGGKVIPQALLDEARTPATLAEGSIARVAGPMGYGLGRAVYTTPGHRWAGHSGGNSTAMRRYLDDDMTIIVLHNGVSDPDAIASAVARAMLQADAGADPQSDLWDDAGDGDNGKVEADLAAGADINALDTRSSRNGRYALNWAAIRNHPDTIALLLQHGAAINARNLTGFTALHHAAESGSDAAGKALLEAGADASLRTADGETAADVARRKGHEPLARMIEASLAAR